jgi:hypothetical protein
MVYLPFSLSTARRVGAALSVLLLLTLLLLLHNSPANQALAADPNPSLVADINTEGSPSHLTNVDGTLFFTARDDTHGKELWTSDRTAAGTTFFRKPSASAS